MGKITEPSTGNMMRNIHEADKPWKHMRNVQWKHYQDIHDFVAMVTELVCY